MFHGEHGGRGNDSVDDFITGEYKKARTRGEMSRYNYDTQRGGKGFQMNSHHVPSRKMNHRYEQCQHENRCKNTPK